MNPSEDLLQQLEDSLKKAGMTQGDIARFRGIRRQSVQQVLSGKKPIIGQTLEATLQVLDSRLVVSRLEGDPQVVHDRAFAYGYKLFLKESTVRHQTFGSLVAWLTTGETKVLNNTLRSLAVQTLFSPILSYEQAVTWVLPLVYGPLTQAHKEVVLLGTEGDDFWDAKQVSLWRKELELGKRSE